MYIQDKIRELMDKRGWTDYKLSMESGLSQSTISNMFDRNTAPTIPTLEMICRAFNITLSQFFAETGAPIVLTPEQIELLDIWNTLNSEQREHLLALMKVIK